MLIVETVQGCHVAIEQASAELSAVQEILVGVSQPSVKAACATP